MLIGLIWGLLDAKLIRMITKQSNMVSVLKDLYSDAGTGGLVYGGNPFMSKTRRGVSMRRIMEALRFDVEKSKLSDNLQRRLETKTTSEGLLGELSDKIILDMEAAVK